MRELERWLPGPGPGWRQGSDTEKGAFEDPAVGADRGVKYGGRRG